MPSTWQTSWNRISTWGAFPSNYFTCLYILSYTGYHYLSRELHLRISSVGVNLVTCMWQLKLLVKQCLDHCHNNRSLGASICEILMGVLTNWLQEIRENVTDACWGPGSDPPSHPSPYQRLKSSNTEIASRTSSNLQTVIEESHRQSEEYVQKYFLKFFYVYGSGGEPGKAGFPYQSPGDCQRTASTCPDLSLLLICWRSGDFYSAFMGKRPSHACVRVAEEKTTSPHQLAILQLHLDGSKDLLLNVSVRVDVYSFARLAKRSDLGLDLIVAHCEPWSHFQFFWLLSFPPAHCGSMKWHPYRPV